MKEYCFYNKGLLYKESVDGGRNDEKGVLFTTSQEGFKKVYHRHTMPAEDGIGFYSVNEAGGKKNYQGINPFYLRVFGKNPSGLLDITPLNFPMEDLLVAYGYADGAINEIYFSTENYSKVEAIASHYNILPPLSDTQVLDFTNNPEKWVWKQHCSFTVFDENTVEDELDWKPYYAISVKFDADNSPLFIKMYGSENVSS